MVDHLQPNRHRLKPQSIPGSRLRQPHRLRRFLLTQHHREQTLSAKLVRESQTHPGLHWYRGQFSDLPDRNR